MKIFLLIGLIAFLSDLTYEGGRTYLGPLLSILGASLLIAAAVTIGEVLSYISRIFSGLIVMKYNSSEVYWILMFFGYILNLFSVPLMGYAGIWETLFILVLLERIGKGIRSPVKDVIVGETGRSLGSGLAYSIHEVLDQGGAILGPLMMALIIGNLGIMKTYTLLFIPAILAIAFLMLAYRMDGDVFRREIKDEDINIVDGGNLKLITYLSGVFLSSMVMIHWAQASYRFSDLSIERFGYLYTYAMFIDGIAALLMGIIYTDITKYVLILIPITAGLSSIHVFYVKNPFIYVILWGVSLGGFESIYKSYLADITPLKGRAFSFGILSIMHGLGMFIGNIVYVYLSGYIGLLYTAVVSLLSTLMIIYSLNM